MIVSDSIPRVLADTPLSNTVIELVGGRVEFVPWAAAQESIASGIQAIYTYGHPWVGPELLDRLPGVKVISNFGVGVDHIDLKAAATRKILVGNTPGILDGATADMAFALLLAAARRVVEGDRYARGPNFVKYDPSYMLGHEVHGTTLGILGLGRIGEQVARRARAFNMTILYHNRRPRPEIESSLDVKFASLDDLLSAADHVVLTVPLTPETRGLIGKAQLARMKPTAALINVARGGVVDHLALAEALAGKQIRAAALDVTEPEPLPRDHPLLSLDNLTIVPHLGSATEQTRRKMAEISIENLLDGMEGKPLRFQVKG